ncbi:hypothetical protein BGW36DRAFT_427872 [Talaromyces proteolyticus]|uniref:Amidohydrolase-related domain-containing protein n=1 Tax=Talaromyces proteolyticus TaxID=1131652 RepID=A0AAD4Q0Y5_9EURO|nr:uncharacterized protein BGW36DRAFT_427872 [Talaromyces proteolyticus]KAH8697937.1 hypothetical protein BGW36DRAFT_427872 [Talaromyces proteolyticus]
MSWLITDVRIFDGERVTLENGFVVVKNGCIENISPKMPVNIPEGCHHISGLGCTLLPGFIDSHVHVYNDASFLAKALRFGVTTLLDMHNEPYWFKEMERLSSFRNDVADIRSACHAATVKGGWPSAIIQLSSDDAETRTRLEKWPNVVDRVSAEAFVEENKRLGASFIKLMQESGVPFDLPFSCSPVPTPSREVQKAIVDKAHSYNMITVGHALSIRDTLLLLDSGVDGFAHACCEELSGRDLSVFCDKRPFVIPTLVIQASAGSEESESREFFSQDLSKEDSTHMCECLGIARKDFTMKNAALNVRLFKKAGLDIVCGTDSSSHLKGVFAGASLHHELWLYVNRCGFTPIEALRSSTSVPSRIFKLHDRGSIKPGLKADLVLVRGDPTKNIECTRSILEVWRNGVRLSSAGDEGNKSEPSH